MPIRPHTPHLKSWCGFTPSYCGRLESQKLVPMTPSPTHTAVPLSSGRCPFWGGRVVPNPILPARALSLRIMSCRKQVSMPRLAHWWVAPNRCISCCHIILHTNGKISPILHAAARLRSIHFLHTRCKVRGACIGGSYPFVFALPYLTSSFLSVSISTSLIYIHQSWSHDCALWTLRKLRPSPTFFCSSRFFRILGTEAHLAAVLQLRSR